MTDIEFEIFTIRNFKTVNPRQLLLAEVRGIKSFFKVKVLSNFDFGYFWKNLLQCHLVGKVLWVQNSSGHYQYVSLALWKTYSKSQEEFFDSFFF